MSYDWRQHFVRATRESRFGAEPPDVIKLAQQKLNDLGFANPPLTVDGSAGPMTQAATRAFQASRGLNADGAIGPQTLAAMGISVTANPPASPAQLIRVPMPAIAGLQQSVIDAYTPYTTKYEGYTSFMYADSKGYVTTGIGNKIDPVSAALALPWKRPDGTLASAAEVQQAWQTVKSAYPGVQSVASSKLTNLRLDQQGVAKLVWAHLNGDSQALRQRYPNYTSWPADAQLALHSIAWAWGPAFSTVWDRIIPGSGSQFDAAVNKTPPDFETAAAVSKGPNQHEEAKNLGIKPRDESEYSLWTNAAQVVAQGLDGSSLFFPNTPALNVGGAVTPSKVIAGGGILLALLGLAKIAGWL